MLNTLCRKYTALLSAFSLSLLMACDSALASLPDPAIDVPAAASKGEQTAVLAGGCFWGVQAVFQHTKGVIRATSGYAGGAANTATYRSVSSGTTGHAEAVSVTYDPTQVSYGQILKIYFAVAHDPTQLNRQGPDVGTQYRSAVFYSNEDQKRIAQAYVNQLTKAKAFPRPVVTQIVPLQAFYPAEDYHQDYLTRHPQDPYIVFNDLPKLDQLREQFPDRYVGK